MRRIKILLFDLFFVISGFVGVGFATGKELEQFFLRGENLLVAVVIFFAIYFIICLVILKARRDFAVKNLQQLNQIVFGKYSFVFNTFTVILFIITSSAMLAGCDNILKNIFNITLPIGSLTLSVITLFVCLNGIRTIKRMSGYIIPILVIFLVVNIISNRGSFQIFSATEKRGGYVFPILFCCENCVMLISVLLRTKSSPFSLSLSSGAVLSIIVFFATIVVANFNGDMPLLLASETVSNLFYFVYLICIIFALFLTLQISSYNACEICTVSQNNKKITAFSVISVGQIISFFGFNFIIKYLYSLMGICGVIFILILFIKMFILKINNK